MGQPGFAGVGVRSGRVMTVDGPIGVEELGVTLTHEHILCDFGCNAPQPTDAPQRHPARIQRAIAQRRRDG